MEGLREGYMAYSQMGTITWGGRLRTWSAYAYVLKHHNEGWAKNWPS